MRRRTSALAIGSLLFLAGCLGSPDDDLGTTASTDGPVAAFTMKPGSDGATFEFDAEPSKGKGLAYAWSFGDGTSGTGKEAVHAYKVRDAVLGVTLVVTDDAGRTDALVQAVVLGSGKNSAPAPTVSVSDDWVAVGSKVTATAAASDAEGDAVSLRIGWAFLGDRVPPELLPAGGDPHAGHGGGGDAAEYAPRENGFDSPAFATDETYGVTLDRKGLYDYHCHPHPWMTGQILVADDPAAASGTIHVSAADLKYWVPGALVVKPGTKIVWENPDPAPHTVTLSKFLPIDVMGAADAGAADVTMDKAGFWHVVAIATDAKGAVGYANALVKVSSDVPPSVIDEEFTGELPAPVSAPGVHALTFAYPGTLEIDFSWTSTSPAEVSRVRLDVFRGTDTSGSPLATSQGGVLDIDVAPDTYTLSVTNEQALQASYSAAAHAVLAVEPEFGGAGDGQAHQH